MENTIKELQEENKQLRDSLNDIAFINEMQWEELSEFWLNINRLITNEIELEGLCNQWYLNVKNVRVGIMKQCLNNVGRVVIQALI